MSRNTARWWAHRRLPAIVFMLGVAFSALLVWQVERQRVAAERVVLLSLATDQAKAIESRIDRLLSSTYLVAAALRKDKGAIIDFESIGLEILPFYPGITSLSLSPGGVITHAVPLEPNRGSIGFNQLQDPQQSPEAFLARDTGQLTLAGPLNLVQGGLGVVGRLPVYLNDDRSVRRFWGFVNVAIRFPEALELTRARGIPGERFETAPWARLPDGSGDPRIQISILPLRVMDLVWRDRAATPHPGDTIIADLNTTEENLPVGTLLQAGTALLRVSDLFNDACVKWKVRYGAPAYDWVRAPGQPDQKVTTMKVTHMDDIRWSPDGRRLVFIAATVSFTA